MTWPTLAGLVAAAALARQPARAPAEVRVA